VIRVFDYYGSPEPDVKSVSDLVSQATGLAFEQHESDYIGVYFMTPGSPRAEIKIMPNELEDEQGKHMRWPEHAEYKTILTAKLVRETAIQPLTFLENLREKLEHIPGLTYLGQKE
jgi:hypothetical protein